MLVATVLAKIKEEEERREKEKEKNEKKQQKKKKHQTESYMEQHKQRSTMAMAGGRGLVDFKTTPPPTPHTFAFDSLKNYLNKFVQ